MGSKLKRFRLGKAGGETKRNALGLPEDWTTLHHASGRLADGRRVRLVAVSRATFDVLLTGQFAYAPGRELGTNDDSVVLFGAAETDAEIVEAFKQWKQENA